MVIIQVTLFTVRGTLGTRVQPHILVDALESYLPKCQVGVRGVLSGFAHSLSLRPVTRIHSTPTGVVSFMVGCLWMQDSLV